MAISIDWATLEIIVPKADLTLVQTSPFEVRSLDLDVFRLALKDIEDSSDGMAFTRTHNHNTTINLGGVILARVIEILEPYTVTFEDGQYAVNLLGANSNVGDKVNVNQVSIRSANSAGLQQVETGVSGLTPAESAQLTAIAIGTSDTVKVLHNKAETNPTTGVQTIYDDDNSTPLKTANLYDDVAGTTPWNGNNPINRRDRLE